MDVLTYAKKLLDHGQRLANAGKYEAIVRDVFCVLNNGHSGWTLPVQRLYEHPQNEAELLLRDAFIKLLNEALCGISDVVYPHSSPDDRPRLFEAASMCFEMLGASAPDKFVLRKETDGVTPAMGTISIHKKTHLEASRAYHAICCDGHDHLTVSEHLNVLEVKLLGELVKSGCREHLLSPFSVNPQMDIDMHECPVEIRPHMRARWELLQSVRIVKKSQLG